MHTPTVLNMIEDDQQAFKKLLIRPTIAWPTVGLFIVALVMHLGSTTLGLSERWPTWASITINALCTYWMFTVAHDASHNSLSLNRWLNDGLGRAAILFLMPMPIFRAFRFIHMQHHRFSNELKDPDYWVGHGSKWTLPIRCAVMDLHYLVWYAPRLKSRPKDEVRDTLLGAFFGAAVLIALIWQGWFVEALLYWLLPSRLAIAFLALAFDYWPHSPYKATEAENKFIATSVRAGSEWLLTPLLLAQNYHLVHHLYPLVPFYRYVKVWRAREGFHLSKSPLLVSVGGTELTRDAYLRTRLLN
jgi:beta-carotene hydroxylase